MSYHVCKLTTVSYSSNSEISRYGTGHEPRLFNKFLGLSGDLPNCNTSTTISSSSSSSWIIETLSLMEPIYMSVIGNRIIRASQNTTQLLQNQYEYKSWIFFSRSNANVE